MHFSACGPLNSLKKVINPVVFGVGGVHNPFLSMLAFCPAVTVVRFGPGSSQSVFREMCFCSVFIYC